MNLIPKICELLGVEIGERFEVDSIDHSQGICYYFTETELLEHRTDRKPDHAQYRILADLIYGDKKIIKLPFEPEYGEKYYRIFIHKDGDININRDTWLDWTTDYMCKYCGNCFRTQAEAEREKYNIYEKLTGKKWSGVAE